MHSTPMGQSWPRPTSAPSCEGGTWPRAGAMANSGMVVEVYHCGSGFWKGRRLLRTQVGGLRSLLGLSSCWHSCSKHS